MTVSFRAKLLASHALVALVVGAVTLVVADRQVGSRMEHIIDQRIETQARAVAQWMERANHPQQLARRLAEVVDARVTVIDDKGIAIGESQPHGPHAGMDSEGVPAEVVAARAGQVGRDTRYSASDRELVRYLAVAATDNRVVRLGVPIGEIAETKRDLRQQLIGAAIASLLVALVLAAIVAGPLTRRLRETTALARKLAAGDYATVQPATGSVRAARDEVGVLSSTLASAAAELHATEQRRRQFLADVAHELRTPVTSIRGYADLLARGAADSETAKEFVQTIHRNALRIGTLVDDLLELEALEAGKAPPLVREPVTIAPIVQHVVDTLRARAGETGARFEVDVASDATVHGDRGAIERIVLNLADNAVRHGGSDVRVAIAARRDGDRMRLTIEDSGPGIPDEQRSRVFERFHRAHNGTASGSGLGLAIARELAVAMGGTLALTGRSTFALELAA